MSGFPKDSFLLGYGIWHTNSLLVKNKTKLPEEELKLFFG